MQITVDPRQVNSSGMDMLELSRTVRRYMEETADVRAQLQRLSGLEECRRDLGKQEDALMMTAGRLLNLSSSLMEIAEVYSTGEDKNVEALEDRPKPGGSGPRLALVCGPGSARHEQIRELLYR